MRFSILLILAIGAFAQTFATSVTPGNAIPMAPITACNNYVQAQMTTATTTQLVALSGTKQIRVCGYQIQGSTTSTATTLKFVAGTGTACGTVTATLTPAWTMPASTNTISCHGAGIGELFQTPSGSALCATSSAAGTVNILVTYAQY